MKITQLYLINKNPVVAKLLSLALQDKELSIVPFENPTTQECSAGVVIVDDAMLKSIDLDMLQGCYVIVLAHDGDSLNVDMQFDVVVEKPFLPSQIKAIIEQALEEITIADEEGLMQEATETIFDEDEVEEIKALLEESEVEAEVIDSQKRREEKKMALIKEELERQGVEIVAIEDMIEGLEEEIGRSQDESFLSEEKKEQLLKRFERFLNEAKPKKIRKLLMGKKTKIKLPKLKDDM